jgi:hypothetical protein
VLQVHDSSSPLNQFQDIDQPHMLGPYKFNQGKITRRVKLKSGAYIDVWMTCVSSREEWSGLYNVYLDRPRSKRSNTSSYWCLGEWTMLPGLETLCLIHALIEHDGVLPTE